MESRKYRTQETMEIIEVRMCNCGGFRPFQAGIRVYGFRCRPTADQAQADLDAYAQKHGLREALMDQRKPAEVFPPCDFIREELHARGWTQKDLAKKMGLTETYIAHLCTGDLIIRWEVAGYLGDAFDTSREYWLNLEKAWQERSKSR